MGQVGPHVHSPHPAALALDLFDRRSGMEWQESFFYLSKFVILSGVRNRTVAIANYTGNDSRGGRYEIQV